jgi:hypothetical protein
VRSPRGLPRAGVGVRWRSLDSRSLMSWPARRSGSDRTCRRRGSGEWTIWFTAVALQLGTCAPAALSKFGRVLPRARGRPAVGAQELLDGGKSSTTRRASGRDAHVANRRLGIGVACSRRPRPTEHGLAPNRFTPTSLVMSLLAMTMFRAFGLGAADRENPTIRVLLCAMPKQRQMITTA